MVGFEEVFGVSYTLGAQHFPLPNSPRKLRKFKRSLVHQSPFKADIFLPTQAMSLQKQVEGLARVVELNTPDNRHITRRKFDALKRAIQQSGAKRIFIVGNGPSLRDTDLSLLKNEITIGFNGVFLHESFVPTIHIVEDHLVGEDRAEEIEVYECPLKIYPSYLAYCLPVQENTIFLNHRPRTSFPFDTDFSDNAGELTYTGGTVTYTGLQVAVSLGFKEIYLVGVDASYKVADVSRRDTYGTGVLESLKDDVNHFHPDYFGKGYRWHDPNVHTMLQAYRKARIYADTHSIRIFNATRGGELEVFPRVDLHSLDQSPALEPRVAVLDFTHSERLCATGILKKRLLDGWPKCSQFHVYSSHPGVIEAEQSREFDCYPQGVEQRGLWAAIRALIEFDADVLYIRPTHDRPELTLLQAFAAASLGKPYVVHYMDDWIVKLEELKGGDYAEPYRKLMQLLFAHADRVLAISQRMKQMIQDEFGVQPHRVEVVHNFYDEGFSSAAVANPRKHKQVVRYFGAIEPDMSLHSIKLLAEAVERISGKGIRLEIYTSDYYLERYSAEFSDYSSTRLLPQLESYEDYIGLLASSDLNALCYNFDKRSEGYLKYSLANKLPELVGVGVPFIAIGSIEIGTIEYLEKIQYPLTVTTPDIEVLTSTIESTLDRGSDMSEGEVYRNAASALSSDFASSRNRGVFQQLLREASASTLPVWGRSEVDLVRELCQKVLDQVDNRLHKSSDMYFLLFTMGLDEEARTNVLRRVRTHGTSWHLDQEISDIELALARVEKNQPASEEQQTDLLAFLLVSLCDPKYERLARRVVKAVLPGAEYRRRRWRFFSRFRKMLGQ